MNCKAISLGFEGFTAKKQNERNLHNAINTRGIGAAAIGKVRKDRSDMSNKKAVIEIVGK